MINDFHSCVARLMNFDVKTYRKPDGNFGYVVIYDDHRSILPVLWAARHHNLIDDAATLMVWDAHPDAVQPHIDSRREAYTRLRGMSELNQVCAYANDELSSNDDTWLVTAMEGGLVGDAVYAFLQSRDNCIWHYEDTGGGSHDFYDLYDIASTLGHQSALVDTCRRSQLEPLWNALSWNVSDNDFTLTERPNLVLDIDIDAFAIEESYPWREEMFCDAFEPLQGFMRKLLRVARLITISKEPYHCGGHAASGEILRYLNYYALGELGIRRL